MIMMGEPGKKIARLIVGADGPPQEEHAEEIMDSSEAIEAAGRSVMSAIRADSPSRLAEAIKEIFNICMSEHEDEEEH